MGACRFDVLRIPYEQRMSRLFYTYSPNISNSEILTASIKALSLLVYATKSFLDFFGSCASTRLEPGLLDIVDITNCWFFWGYLLKFITVYRRNTAFSLSSRRKRKTNNLVADAYDNAMGKNLSTGWFMD